MADERERPCERQDHAPGAFRRSLRVAFLVLIAVAACLNVAWTRNILNAPLATNAVGLSDPNANAFAGALVGGQHLRDHDASSYVGTETVRPSELPTTSSSHVDPLTEGLDRVEQEETEQPAIEDLPATTASPLLVHYTAKKPSLAMEAAWAKVNGPQIDIRYYSDADALRLVAQHRPHFLAIYTIQLSPVERADYFRYLVLWVFGGLYVDSDVEFVRPVHEWLHEFQWDSLGTLDTIDLTVGVEFPHPQTGYDATGWLPLQLTQFVIAGAQGSRVLTQILDHIETCVRSVDRQGDVERTLQRTGPAAFTRAILNEIQARGVVAVAVETMHSEFESDPRYPRALLPCDTLEKKGQLISLRGDSEKNDAVERVLVLPYRAFAFHASHGIAKEAVLTRHLFHNSWRHNTA